VENKVYNEHFSGNNGFFLLFLKDFYFCRTLKSEKNKHKISSYEEI